MGNTPPSFIGRHSGGEDDVDATTTTTGGDADQGATRSGISAVLD
jgi:hypothetical protein